MSVEIPANTAKTPVSAQPGLIQLTILGQPHPCERARRGKQGHWYTPEPTRDYKQRVGWAWKQARARSFGDLELTVSASFFIQRPPSHLKASGHVRDRYVDMTPPGDLDNYLKGLLDGLQDAGAFHDDKQIVCLSGIHKHWTVSNGIPRTRLSIWPANTLRLSA